MLILKYSMSASLGNRVYIKQLITVSFSSSLVIPEMSENIN